jgi:tRNA threonylcarbamoyladenosine biosynthesis protein TsaE
LIRREWQWASAAETFAGGEHLGARLTGGDILLLAGDLGAGKTVFAKGVAVALGVEGLVTSPTFVIVQDYICKNGLNFVHMDLYRLRSLSEVEEIGIMDFFTSKNICLIEWPELILPYVPPEALTLEISGSGETLRSVVCTGNSLTWEERL